MDALNLQPGKAVFILWEDSASLDGWHRAGRYATVGTISTVGFVVGRNDAGVTVTSSLNDEFSNISPLTIPWSCITQCEVLEPEWGKPFVKHDCMQAIGVVHRIAQEDRDLTEKYEKICRELQNS